MKFFALILLLIILHAGIRVDTLQAQNQASHIQFGNNQKQSGYFFKKIKHPEMFQGNNREKQYFEGWYFKMVSEDSESILSFIPGISLSSNGLDKHAFIQVIDGKTAQTLYYTFPIEDFYYSPEKFEISIGKNFFSNEKIVINLEDENTSLQGEVHFKSSLVLPANKFMNAGIMGWYRFVPFMQCYHGVVSLTHELEDSILMNQKVIPFSRGKGYIEKDWGTSMPSAWIWIQSNNFNHRNASFMLSVATIPWLGGTFTGFLGFFTKDSTIYRFATYTRASLQVFIHNANSLSISISDKKFTYHIEALRLRSGLLKAPVNGSMDRRIAESIDAGIKLKILDAKGQIIFNDSTRIAGLEMVGDLEKLISNLK